MGAQLAIGLSIRRPSAIVSMSLPITQLAVAAVVSVIRRTPLIVDVRDLPFETAAEIGYLHPRWLVTLLVRVETLLLRRAVVLLTNSPHYKKHLGRRGIDEQRITVAPIGYDDFGPVSEDLVDAWRRRFQIAFGAEPPKFVAVYAGTIGHAFPIGRLLDVASHLSSGSSIGLVMLGDGQRLDEYSARAARDNLPVRFLGRVPKEEVHAACRAASACLYPAGDGVYSAAILGNKIFDYLGAERPIVYIGHRGAVSDIMEQLGAGVVCSPDSPEESAQLLERLSQDALWQRSLAKRASRYREAGLTARASAELLRRLVDYVAR
jgi:glycosyltransferase involved in cell wall biosynthesis